MSSPDSNLWPSQGEIDFPEGELNSNMYASVYYMGDSAGSQQDAYPTGEGYDPWHTAVIEWTPAECTFILDGNVVRSSTCFIPSAAMHWVLQTETSLDGEVPADSTSGNMLVDMATDYTPD